MKELFIDGIIGLGTESGIIRIDYGSLSATETDADGNALMEHRQRLVMSPDAFLQTYEAMTRMFNQMEETGVIVKQSPQEEEGADGEIKLEKEEVPPSSPNFN